MTQGKVKVLWWGKKAVVEEKCYQVIAIDILRRVHSIRVLGKIITMTFTLSRRAFFYDFSVGNQLKIKWEVFLPVSLPFLLIRYLSPRVNHHSDNSREGKTSSKTHEYIIIEGIILWRNSLYENLVNFVRRAFAAPNWKLWGWRFSQKKNPNLIFNLEKEREKCVQNGCRIIQHTR